MGEQTASDAGSEGAWIPMFALPLVDLDPKVVIEVPGLALVSADDDRVQALARHHPRFATYLGAFTTEFGQAITPSVLIRHSTSPETYRNVEGLAGFRDAVALAVIPYAWTLTLRHDTAQGIRYANWFSFYPWMTDARYEGVIMSSMAQLGYHLVEELKPQTFPGFAPMLITRQMVDWPLLDALLDRWQQRFGLSIPSHDQVALFRALNMAQAAAQAPGNVETTIYDIGRSIALWVSAFEILAHPGGTGLVQKSDVIRLLESVSWKLSDCSNPIYAVKAGGADRRSRILPVWLYDQLCAARHDFLHGNDLTPERLIVPPGRRPLHLYAAPLFRMALAAFLGLRQEAPEPRQGQTEYEAYMTYDYEFGRYQRDTEAALATILHSEPDPRTPARRSRVMRRGARQV